MHLAIGQVFYLHCQTCTTPKPKFFVVATLQPLKCFVINSQPTAFQLADPKRLAALTPIRADQHPFLVYDSYVGCNALFSEYDEPALQAVLAKNPSAFRGVLHQDAITAVRATIANSVLLSPVRKRELLAVW
jgi:hypothetical protein